MNTNCFPFVCFPESRKSSTHFLMRLRYYKRSTVISVSRIIPEAKRNGIRDSNLMKLKYYKRSAVIFVSWIHHAAKDCQGYPSKQSVLYPWFRQHIFLKKGIFKIMYVFLKIFFIAFRAFITEVNKFLILMKMHDFNRNTQNSCSTTNIKTTPHILWSI